MGILEADGQETERYRLMFVVDCLLNREIAVALVRQVGINPNVVRFWAYSAVHAHAPAPARPPSDEEPEGFEGREVVPLPAGLLDEILYALTKDRSVRQLVCNRLLKQRRIPKADAMKELLGFKEQHEANLQAKQEGNVDLALAKAAVEGMEAPKSTIILTD